MNQTEPTMIKRLPFIFVLIFLLVMSTQVSAQQGEKTIGITLNPARFYDNFNNSIFSKELWSVGAGFHFHYQVFDRFGVMFNPHFRYFSKFPINSICHSLPCPNHLQYSTIDLPVLATFNLLNNPQGKTQIYLQAGYAYQHGIYRHFSTEGGFGGDYSSTDTQLFHQAHQLLLGLEIRHSIGSKFAFAWGVQYNKPYQIVSARNFADNYSPLWLLNLRFSRVFH